MCACHAALPLAVALGSQTGLKRFARLQDQGTGGDGLPVTPRTSVDLRCCVRLGGYLGSRREPGAAVARQGLRAAGPATASVPGSQRLSQLRTVVAPGSGRCARCVALCMPGSQPARRAPRALEDVLKVLTYHGAGYRELRKATIRLQIVTTSEVAVWAAAYSRLPVVRGGVGACPCYDRLTLAMSCGASAGRLISRTL